MQTKELVRAALFTALMCVITIMVRVFQPVLLIPFSLQPLVMLVAAYLLTPRAAFLSMLAYLMLGLMGLPVFSVAPYGGPGYVLLPSFGFLLAFPVAAWFQSRMIRSNNLVRLILAGAAGILLMYAIGLPYMYGIFNFYMGKVVDIKRVLELGFIPFILFDLGKVVAAALLTREISRRMDGGREFHC